MAKYLSVVDGAYRASMEEQDDAALWFTGAVKTGGLDCDILLTGNAVNYAVKNHKSGALDFGGGHVEHQMNPKTDLERMASNGVKLFLVKEDVDERGIEPGELMPGIEGISRSGLTELIDQYDGIWHW